MQNVHVDFTGISVSSNKSPNQAMNVHTVPVKEKAPKKSRASGEQEK